MMRCREGPGLVGAAATTAATAATAAAGDKDRGNKHNEGVQKKFMHGQYPDSKRKENSQYNYTVRKVLAVRQKPELCEQYPY